MTVDDYIAESFAAINVCVGFAQIDPDVSIEEYNQLVSIQKQLRQVAHKAWARKTFKGETK